MTQATKQAGLVLSFADARACVEKYAALLRPLGTEPAKLLESTGRVLAENIVADCDFPPFPRATRDGYAVRAADVANVPAKLKVVGQIRAGHVFNETIESGTCAEIMTGAPVPAGADAVVMVEYTNLAGAMVEIKRSVTAGENVVPTGSEARAGQVLLPARMPMDYTRIAVAASVGRKRVE